MPTLYVLIGLPGSGKTKRCDELLCQNGSAVVISHDDVVGRWANMRDISMEEARQTLDPTHAHDWQRQIAHDAIAERADLIIDRCNLTERSRRQWRFLTSLDYDCVAIWLNVPLEECIARVTAEGRGITEERMRKMHSQFRHPRYDGWFHEIIEE